MFNGECKVAAIWLYSKDPERAAAFYRDALEMKQIEHGKTNSFDGGGLRVSIHPLPEGTNQVPTGECFLAFFVKSGIEEKRKALKDRGVGVSKIEAVPYGQIVSFEDPDGHELFLWQPPPKGSKNYERVEKIVEHYESVESKLGK
jgi:predicted enzyme related to lactoylglutathione lyase